MIPSGFTWRVKKPELDICNIVYIWAKREADKSGKEYYLFKTANLILQNVWFFHQIVLRELKDSCTKKSGNVSQERSRVGKEGGREKGKSDKKKFCLQEWLTDRF